MKKSLSSLAVSTLLLFVGGVAAQQSFDDCGGISHTSWDYTDPKNWRPSGDAPQTRIRLVENVHFTSKIENLVRGVTAVNPVGDITYTLNRFPNHPRALWALSRASRHPQWHTKTSPAKLLCYFDKALHLHPKDTAVLMVYGMHLHITGKLDDAEQKYRLADELGMSSSEFHYNYGLLLFDQGELDLAKTQARLAYEQGYPLPGLRRKLSDAGRWP